MVPWLAADAPFPPLSQALGRDSGASGLLAASADITPARLASAYRSGIFPWYSKGQPVLWWSPDPRMVLEPARFRVSASFRKTLRRVLRESSWEVRVDDDFGSVMQACAAVPRAAQDGTWITDEIVAAYQALHRDGLAHSVETWHHGVRVGGLYGVAMGRMFFGESMFAERPDASKIALAALVAHLSFNGVEMIDCQQNTAHLASLGGHEIARSVFIKHLSRAVVQAPIEWAFDKSVLRGWVGMV